MDKKSRKKQNRNFFIKQARKKARPVVEKRRAKLAERGEKLSREEENKNIERIAKKIKKEVLVRSIIIGITGTIGVGAGATGMKLLNDANNKGITQTQNEINIDAIEAGKDIKITNKDENNKYNERGVFINGIKVDLNEQENQIKANASQKLEELKEKNETLEYIKGFIAQEYNEENGTEISTEEITIEKNIYGVALEKDEAKNGDEIFRCKNSSGKYQKGIYTVTIKTDNGTEKEKISRNWNGQSVRVYDSDVEVEKYEENAVSKMRRINYDRNRLRYFIKQ